LSAVSLVALGICHEAGVLHGIQKPLSIVLGIGPLLLHEVREHGDNFSLARLECAGQCCVAGWDDLLQEAFTRVLVGSRLQPEGVTMVAFLAGVMRSLKTEHWRRTLARTGSRQTLRIDQAVDETGRLSCAIRRRAPSVG
jgi:hypothetical protein